jgi:hypothetical protein
LNPASLSGPVEAGPVVGGGGFGEDDEHAIRNTKRAVRMRAS